MNKNEKEQRTWYGASGERVRDGVIQQKKIHIKPSNKNIQTK